MKSKDKSWEVKKGQQLLQTIFILLKSRDVGGPNEKFGSAAAEEEEEEERSCGGEERSGVKEKKMRWHQDELYCRLFVY